MKLHDLFEQDNNTELAPGEKKALLGTIADLSKLKNKISDNQSFLSSLSYTLTPASRSLAAKFNELKQDVENKINSLKAKLAAERSNLIDNNPEITEIFNKIEQECSDYLQAVRTSGRILYRGSKNAPEAYIGRSWDQRKAKDSNQRAQAVFDRVIARLGFKANRGNSIFCSPRMSQAESYGKVYYVFPKNGFHFLYTNEDDLIMDSSFMGRFIDESKCADYVKKFGDWFLEKYPEHKQDSRYAVQELGRILEGAKADSQYYTPKMVFNSIDSIISDPWYNMNDIPNELALTDPDVYASMVDTDKFTKAMKPKDSDLAEFLEFRTGEICISGTFYALSVARFEEMVTKKFLS